MKKITFLVAILISAASFAQIARTSFENPAALAGQYTDTGDANVAHDLVNNTDQPLVDFVTTGDEIGFNARYVPFDTPDVGLTDGDFIGVTSFQPTPDIPFTDGAQGYQISDVDGNFILEFDPVSLVGASAPNISIDYFISINGDGTGGNFEGDGTLNTSGSDRLRIYVKDLTNGVEVDIVNSTGADLDNLVPIDTSTGNFVAAWQTGNVSLSPGINAQLVIEVRCNASAEAFFFDNVVVNGILGLGDTVQETFSMYPNPVSSGVLNISSKNAGAINVAIFDVLGKQVMSFKSSRNKSLNISALNSGVYIVKITQGNLSSTKKLVVR